MSNVTAEFNKISADKVVLVNPQTGLPIMFVESTEQPGFYVLPVGNYDGSPITGGGGGGGPTTGYGYSLYETEVYV